MRRFLHTSPVGKKRRLIFEQLETRALLAGNVNVAVNAGELDITGDAASNSIQVTQLASGQWKVTGTATKINGGNAAFVTTAANPVTGDIDIDLGQGNNTLQMQNGAAPANVNIGSGSGNDVLTVRKVTSNSSVGTISIAAGDGSNVINVNNVTVPFEISIAGGTNADSIAVSNASTLEFDISAGNGANAIAVNNASARSMDILGGANSDSVALNNVSSEKDLEVRLGDGTNALFMNHFSSSDNFVTSITAGNGRNSIALANISMVASADGGELSIQTGDGPNSIALTNVSLSGCSLSISTGNGNDSISLTRVNVPLQDIFINTGAGTDAVTLNAVTCVYLDVYVGPGNFDTLSIFNTTITDAGQFEDVGGTNGILIGANNHLTQPPDVIGFAYRIGI